MHDVYVCVHACVCNVCVCMCVYKQCVPIKCVKDECCMQNPNNMNISFFLHFHSMLPLCKSPALAGQFALEWSV